MIAAGGEYVCCRVGRRLKRGLVQFAEVHGTLSLAAHPRHDLHGLWLVVQSVCSLPRQHDRIRAVGARVRNVADKTIPIRLTTSFCPPPGLCGSAIHRHRVPLNVVIIFTVFVAFIP